MPLSEPLIILGLMIALAVTAVLVALSAARRQVEVSVRHKAGAPLAWAIHPGKAAILHRRLRRAVAGVRLVIPVPRRRSEPTALQTLAEDFERLAAATARNMIAASYTDRGRRRHHLAQLRSEVVRIERIATGLRDDAVHLDPERPSRAAWALQADDLQARLRHRAEARAELAALEQQPTLEQQPASGQWAGPSDVVVPDLAHAVDEQTGVGGLAARHGRSFHQR